MIDIFDGTPALAPRIFSPDEEPILPARRCVQVGHQQKRMLNRKVTGEDCYLRASLDPDPSTPGGAFLPLRSVKEN
jgi:hypothetical protein